MAEPTETAESTGAENVPANDNRANGHDPADGIEFANIEITQDGLTPEQHAAAEAEADRIGQALRRITEACPDTDEPVAAVAMNMGEALGKDPIEIVRNPSAGQRERIAERLAGAEIHQVQWNGQAFQTWKHTGFQFIVPALGAILHGGAQPPSGPGAPKLSEIIDAVRDHRATIHIDAIMGQRPTDPEQRKAWDQAKAEQEATLEELKRYADHLLEIVSDPKVRAEIRTAEAQQQAAADGDDPEAEGTTARKGIR